MNEFVHRSPTADAYWRSVILFGENQASYKFALGRTLLGLADEGKTFVSLEELAEPYVLSIVEHIGRADRQGTSKSCGPGSGEGRMAPSGTTGRS